MCLVALVAVALVLKLPGQEKTNMTQKLRRIDFLGAMVLICAVFSLLVGLDRGSNVAWRDSVTISTMVAGLVLAGAFILVELKISTEPIAPYRVIFERSLFACYLCNFFSFAGWMAALFYLSLYYQGYYGATATEAGLLMIPQILASVSGSLFGGFYIRKTGKYFWLTVAAYIAVVFGMLIILCSSGLIVHAIPATVIGAMICGFGNGIGVTSTLIGLIANVKRDDQATATACSYLFRSLGSTTGVSLSATVFNEALRISLARGLGSGKVAERIQESVRRSLQRVRDLEPGVRGKVRHSYGVGTQAAFGLELGFIVGAAIAAWFIREKPLSRS